MRYECPEGFTEGRIKPSEETRNKMSKSQIKRWSLEK